LVGHADQPWSTLRFWVRGDELLFSNPESDQVVATSPKGQVAMPIELEPVALMVAKEARSMSHRPVTDIGLTERRRNIQGNRLLVKGTRVPVESIVSLSNDGYRADEIVQTFPSLTIADVHSVLQNHRESSAA